MSKVLHSRHNKIFLDKLRKLRESRQLRQADLCKMLGRSQGWVSYIESGQTTLHIIELRQWLAALGVEFLDFLNELDAELRLLEAICQRAKPPRRLARNALSQLVQAGLSMDTVSVAPAQATKPAKRQVRR
ncbi:helix-turn-helix domain-containing protein [Roseateles sp.]|uniref:helix-turn-helix domain-containing protein n=1 Tax=Roseateles sp. TaxID=1971397 RepID=UPI003BA98659